MIYKIYDCSNSNKRQPHRNGGGPIQNDVMRQLKEKSSNYGFKYVSNYNQADIIITNDVYPDEIFQLNKPLVKRMDGVFWLKSLIHRNEQLNMAAQKSDHVIFISKYSHDSYYNLYGQKIKNSTIILNSADTTFFKPVNIKTELKTFVASATDWSRSEKRLKIYIEFARKFPEYKILLIGKCDQLNLPKNIILFGYQTNEIEMAKIMNKADAMLSFSYRDPCPKTISQGIACGLPILFSNSGGQPEQVKYGVAIQDSNNIVIEEEDLSCLQITDIEESLLTFKKQFRELSINAFNYALTSNSYNDMIKMYYDVFKTTIHNY